MEENRWPEDRPPFDPFPTVSDVVNAWECPVLALHNLLHGEDNLIRRDREWTPTSLGSRYHQFIALIKSRILAGELEPREREISRLFNTTQIISPDQRNQLRRPVIELIGRKREELNELQGNILFEVATSNARVEFEHEGGRRTYPLRGRIDELDIDNERLIERTIMRGEDGNPPRGKDFQAWIYWKSLCSLNRDDIPKPWRDVDFGNFTIVVETPGGDYRVEKENENFERGANEAFTWIQNLYRGNRAIWEAYQQKACTYENRRENCGAVYFCYGRNYPYPRASQQMRRQFRGIYRSLLNEIMWERDLFHYQLLMLDPNVLEERGLISRAELRSYENDELEVEVDPDQTTSIIGHDEVSDATNFTVVLGNFSFGIRLKANLEEVDGNRFGFNVFRTPPPPVSTISIIPSSSSVYSEDPWFLNRVRQKDMFRLQRSGRIKEEKAREDSLVRLVDGIFGTVSLRREDRE